MHHCRSEREQSTRKDQLKIPNIRQTRRGISARLTAALRCTRRHRQTELPFADPLLIERAGPMRDHQFFLPCFNFFSSQAVIAGSRETTLSQVKVHPLAPFVCTNAPLKIVVCLPFFFCFFYRASIFFSSQAVIAGSRETTLSQVKVHPLAPFVCTNAPLQIGTRAEHEERPAKNPQHTSDEKGNFCKTNRRATLYAPSPTDRVTVCRPTAHRESGAHARPPVELPYRKGGKCAPDIETPTPQATHYGPRSED